VRLIAERRGTGVVVGLLLLLLTWLQAEGQAQRKAPARQAPAHPMREAQVGDPAVGKQLFQKKGCINCHAIKGEGGTVGPDLGKIQHTHNIYQMASIMWNHSVQERKAMEEMGIRRPEFKGDEFAHLLAYIHSLEVVGNPEKGKLVFERKGCVRCHAIHGEGGKIGPELAQTSHPHPPIELVGMMWNHSPTMTALMQAMGIPRPTFQGNEMADLLAYLSAVQREAARGHAPAGHHHGH